MLVKDTENIWYYITVSKNYGITGTKATTYHNNRKQSRLLFHSYFIDHRGLEKQSGLFYNWACNNKTNQGATVKICFYMSNKRGRTPNTTKMWNKLTT